MPSKLTFLINNCKREIALATICSLCFCGLAFNLAISKMSFFAMIISGFFCLASLIIMALALADISDDWGNEKARRQKLAMLGPNGNENLPPEEGEKA